MNFRIIAVLACCGGSLPAADYFISPAGLDGNPGSLAQPWQSFAHAVPQLAAGDTLHLRAGIYAERLIVVGKSGTAGAPVVIRPYENEAAVIDGTTLTVPTGGRAGLVKLENCNHVHLRGLEIRNYETTAATRTPAGIQIEGSGSGLRVLDCKVHHIRQSSTTAGSNGFGIAVYGTSSSPIDGLVLDGNEVHDLRTGQSESVVLNGNVTNFTVSRNHVHDCNNIGIDLIGYEGSAPAGFDRARDGVVRENLVHGIDSAFNPGYGGNFISGGGDRSAAGIYIDGGTNITVERNRVYGCNFGIELASENAAGFTDQIRLLNNLLHHNLGPGLIMGGYDHLRGKTRLCEVRNNTLFRNDSLLTFGGQVALQFYFENNVFKNNLVWANATSKQMIIHYVKEGTAAQRAFGAGNVFDSNVYFCEGNEADIEFGLNPTGSGGSQGNKSYNGLAAWRTAIGGEANSAFNNPGFVVPVPSNTPAAADFKISAASFCRDRGDLAAPSPGEKDFFGSSRLANGRTDIGAHEFMTALQAWRDLYFSLPDGTGIASDDADPESDGTRNLVEYSQGMNPLVSDPQLGPAGFRQGSVFRFQYRKQAPDLSYEVQTSTDFSSWPATGAVEQSGGNGLFWRDFPIGAGRIFVRLAVEP
jgi:parallel beta-helix repeat protein